MGLTAAVVAATAVAAGTSAFQAHEQSVAKSKAIDEKGRREKLQEKAIKDAEARKEKDKEEFEEKIATQDRERARAARFASDKLRKRSGISRGTGRKGGTLLTGPLGIQESDPGTSGIIKTLLGA